MNTFNIEVLNAGLAEYRAGYVAKVQEAFLASLRNMRERLSENGMDLNKVAPYPNSFTTGRKQYVAAKSKHDRYKSCFADQDGSGHAVMARLHGKAPWLVVERPDAESKIRAQAAIAANACFDGYVAKLSSKMGESIISARMTGDHWEGSTLTVECFTRDENNCKREQVWTTKCIMNVSCLGKVFNQWPTRRMN